MKEIVGKVVKLGKLKDYGHDTNFGREWVPIYKFFIQVASTEHGLINAMVEVPKVEDGRFGPAVPKDSLRQRPLIGDTVKFTTHRLQKKNDATWASVTDNQTYEITIHDPAAQKEREAFIKQKQDEREAKFQGDKCIAEQNRLDADLERLSMRETEMNDDRLPESVRDQMNTTFTWDTILSILRETYWFGPRREGDGGKQATYDIISGAMLEEGYPGNGMRRPGGPLHDKSANIRKSILDKAIKSGLIRLVQEITLPADCTYETTELGLKTLALIDRCPDCGEIRRPVKHTSHYSMNYGNGHGYTNHYDHGATWYCTCELNDIYKHQVGSNCGSTFKELKVTKERLTKINAVIGATAVPAVPSSIRPSTAIPTL